MTTPRNPYRRQTTISLLIAAAFFSFITAVCLLIGYLHKDGPRPPFPTVTPATTLILGLSDPDTRAIDLTGDREIVEAIGGLNGSTDHSSRSIGETRVHGTLMVDGAPFTLDACLTESGCRATLSNDDGEWISERLGTCLYTRYGHLKPQHPEVPPSRPAH